MTQTVPDLRWGVKRRLEFIEFRLYWEGGINRADIIDFFGVSVPQASKDLTHYQDLARGNMDYDKREKRYVVAKRFKPRFFTPDAERYLSQLRLIAEQVVPPEETWLSNLPDLDLMPIPRRQVDPSVLQVLLAVIRDERAADIYYQSMNPRRPEPIWRGISPHALASDGFRWHVRAYCHMERKFKDFLLSRCLNCVTAGPKEQRSEHDELWQTVFKVRLKPNPKLSKAQQDIIASDYAMDKNKLELPVRRALLYYFKKRLRLDVADALDDPKEVPVIIANRAAFDKALEATRE